jgi:hypothetical protein
MLRSIRSTPRVWLLVLLVFTFSLLAVPATAEVFHVTLKNGTTLDSSLQPQQASWDPNMVMLMTEVGNWVGFSKDEISDIKVVDPTAGFGVRISSTAIALGRFSNDLPEAGKGNPLDDLNSRYLSLASKTLEMQERQQHYSIQQGVATEQTQGIPAAFSGYGAGYGGNGMTSNVMPPQGSQPVITMQPRDH